MAKEIQSSLFKRIESEINTYISGRVELSPGVFFSQYKTINRIYRFKNRDLSGSKINSDLSYNYYFDIISPRVDSEVKNLRFDTKHILVFSEDPRKDFAAVFLANASLKSWMAENGEDEKLKEAVEEFSGNGNIGFKKVAGGYEIVDAQNTYITNQIAKTVDETDIIERHEMSPSQIKRMTEWDQDIADVVIKDLGDKSFTSSKDTTPISTTGKKYEIFEFTGEVSEKEFNEVKGLEGGDPNKYFLAKVIVAGLSQEGKGEKYPLFVEKLKGKMSDYYKYAHRGRYEGRFWRVGVYELLFDHQIRANEIGNQLSRGLEWASKVIFRSRDSKVLQNIRADLDNGDVIITDDLTQVNVRLQGLDQLIADWNRLMNDADRLANSMEVTRGESLPSGTPFRMGILLDQNAGKIFSHIRQKLTLPYRSVFREWVIPELLKDMKAKEVFQFLNDQTIIEQLQEILVQSWYMNNLVAIGPHTQEVAEAIKQQKLEEIKKKDITIKNVKEIWANIRPRVFVTITGENYDLQDQLQDLVSFLNLEQDPRRIEWILDTIYKTRGIPIPPKQEQQPIENQLTGNTPTQTRPERQSPEQREAEQPMIQ